MSNTSWAITVGYSVVTIIGVAICLIVFRSTRVGFKTEVAGRETLEKRESYWGIAVIAFLVVVLGGTIVQIPYWTDNGKEKVPQTVDVTGRQYAWTVNPARVRAGLKTRFKVRSADVSHAIGLYDPDDVLIKQVNAAPGETQDFIITLDEPGVYRVLCLEFCGVDHHLMKNELEVTR